MEVKIGCLFKIYLLPKSSMELSDSQKLGSQEHGRAECTAAHATLRAATHRTKSALDQEGPPKTPQSQSTNIDSEYQPWLV